MENFVSVIINKDNINEDRDIVLDSIITTGNIGLLENEIEYEIYESENNTQVISVPLNKELTEKQQEVFANKLANKLFDKGHTEFDIEFSLNEVAISSTLRRGSRGNDVKQVQQFLGIPADGIFGPQTERAVRAFQKKAGIQVDGIVGKQTQQAILRSERPDLDINVGQTGPSYIDAPYPTQQAQQPKVGRAIPPKPELRPDTPKPKLRPEPRGDLAQLPRAMDIDTADPRNDSDSGFRQSDRPSMFATDVPDKEATGVWKVVPDGKGTFNLVGPDGVVDRSVGQNGRFSQTKVPEMEDEAQRRNQQQGLTAPAQGNLSSRLDTKGQTPDDPTRGSPTPDVDGSDIVQPVADPDENEPRTFRNTKDYYAWINAGKPSVWPPVDAPSLGTPDDEDQPSVSDDNDATQRQMIDQQQWEKKYGSSPRDLSAGLPAEFTTQYLNPALDDLTSDAAGDLASEVKGAPPPVARLVMDRMRQSLGVENGDEILDMAREIEQEEPDQASALSTLAEIYKQLELTAEPKGENVSPRPKGAFMFRERNEWIANYGKTHNKDGSLKTRTFISESKMQEVTFHNDDEFFEAYGVLWFNEDEVVDEAEYQGRKVKLGKPMAGDVKKFKVYVRNPKGNVVKVNFGQKGAKIKKSNPERRRSFRARHNCDNPGPRHKARYWSCRKW